MHQSLAICICTMDRPEILKRCLDSIAAGSRLPSSVWISDDSKNASPIKDLCAQYSWAKYISGPRRGLCANRNHVTRHASSDYIALLDDDAAVSTTFVEQVASIIAGSQSRKTIITGDVLEGCQKLKPRNPSFWGHFTKIPTNQHRTINLNCNTFPAAAFVDASFDEAITYGYEDMDLCAQLLAKGYQIVYDPDLQNSHFPNREDDRLMSQRSLQTERARFYTSIKRYLVWEQKPLKALVFCLAAPLHRAAHDIIHKKLGDLAHCLPDIIFAAKSNLARAPATKQSRTV